MSATLPIERMNVKEKLRAMEALWASLCENESKLPMPQWHKDLLDERKRLLAAGKAKFLSWESAKRRILARVS